MAYYTPEPKTHLLTSQRDELFEFIQESPLNPSDFEWHALASSRGAAIGERLLHRPTGFFFNFLDAQRHDPQRKAHGSSSTGKHSIHYSPADQTREDWDYWIGWPLVRIMVNAWLSALNREYRAPDLWQQLREDRSPVLRPGIQEDSPFSPDELTQVDESVDEIKNNIRANQERLGLSKGETELILGQFEEVKGIARTIDKKGFRIFLIGTLVNVASVIAYNPERTRELMGIVGKAFNWLFDLTLMLPPPT